MSKSTTSSYGHCTDCRSDNQQSDCEGLDTHSDLLVAALAALEMQPQGGGFTQEQARLRRNAKHALRAAIAKAKGGAPCS